MPERPTDKEIDTVIETLEGHAFAAFFGLEFYGDQNNENDLLRT